MKYCRECEADLRDKRFCGDCGVQSVAVHPPLLEPATGVPLCPASAMQRDEKSNTATWIVGILAGGVALVVFLAMAGGDRSSPSPGTRSSAAIAIQTSGDQYASLVGKYGQPDRFESTAYDRPPPLVVTRIIEYRLAGVKIAFVPDAKTDEPPPYPEWKIIGFIDTRTETALSASAALERLAAGRD